MSSPVRFALSEIVRYWQTAEEAGFTDANAPDYDSAKTRMRRMWLGRRVQPDLSKLPGDFVMQSQLRKPYQTTNGGRDLWRPLMVAAELMDGDDVLFTVHALRHAAASLFIENGLPAMNIQRLMGHASVTMTFDVYGHLFPDDDRDSVAAHAVASGLLRDKIQDFSGKPLISP